MQVSGGRESCCGCSSSLVDVWSLVKLILTKPKEKWKATGKSIWEGLRDKEKVTVEMQALQYYEHMGFKGFILL